MHPFRLPFLASALLAASPLGAQPASLHPVGNYHAHLVSPETAKLLVVRPLPTVQLPADLDRVLRDYALSLKNPDPPAFSRLFTEDGLFPHSTGWVRGREAIVAAAKDFDPIDARIRPHAYQLTDSVATIAASLVNQDDSSGRDIAKVSFTLHRGPDARWLIASFLRDNVPSADRTLNARQLIAQHDSAGIRRAVVLSTAYWFGSSLMPGGDPTRSVTDEYAKVRAENDWVAAETARYPDRLVGFCSFHPLKPYALDEVARCKSAGLRGVKLHLANSGVDLRKAEDVEQLRRVFRAANAERLPIVVHMRPRQSPYGRPDVEVFLRQIAPEAPDIPIQIAHLAGWGSFDEAADEAAGTFAEAIARKDAATRNLWFDITSIVHDQQPLERRQAVARRIREIGLKRIVYGSDLTDPKADWASVMRLIPLSRAEFAIIAGNVAPYLGR